MLGQFVSIWEDKWEHFGYCLWHNLSAKGGHLDRAAAADSGRTTLKQCQEVLFPFVSFLPSFVLDPSGVNTPLIHEPKIQAAKEWSEHVKELSDQTHISKRLAFLLGDTSFLKDKQLELPTEWLLLGILGHTFWVLLDFCFSPIWWLCSTEVQLLISLYVVFTNRVMAH